MEPAATTTVKTFTFKARLCDITPLGQALGGKLYTVYVYRAGKQKIYDFELGMEVFKTFNPQYSAYQLRLRYENRDRTDCSYGAPTLKLFLLPNARKGKTVTSERVVLNDGDYWMAMVGNGNNVIGNYKVSYSGIPAYYDSKEDAYYRVNFTNSVKQSFLLRINGSSLDLRYVLMRSAEPMKYIYSDEHYRIDFKDATLEYPCFVENLIVHEGFSIYFEWFMNESVEWKWRSLNPDQKHTKKPKQKATKKSQAKPSKQQPKRSKATRSASISTPEIVPSKQRLQVQKAEVTAVKKAARPIIKKKVKLMSEKKFKALEFKMQLHITISKKEREIYNEQRVLRRLKRFLG